MANNSPFLARFADAPALVAAERQGEFDAALQALAADTRLPEAMSAASGQDETFWTELGRFGSIYRPYVVQDGLLTIPVRGVLLNDFPYQAGTYATGYAYVRKAFERGLGDADVKGIALIVNSPGGEVAGNFDLVDVLYAGRGQKPIRAFAAEYAYSAAYSIASAADRLSVPRTGGVGSIGVVTMHVDVSAALEQSGIKVTMVYAGKHKVDSYPYAPLSDAAKARMQERVDALYEVFVSTVARNRKLDAQAVRDTEALTFMASEAVANGLADQVGSLDSALAEFQADLNNPDQGDETMSDSKPAMTVASAKADYPDVANALIAEGREAAKAENKAAIDQAVAADRGRVGGLDALAAKFGNSPKVMEIVTAAKADGSTPEATAMKIIDADAHKPAAALAGLEADGQRTVAVLPASPGAGAVAATPQTPEGWAAEWQGSDKLQAEFPSAAAYAAHQKYELRRKGGAN